MVEQHFTSDDLINLKPEKDTFVGIDSDGCVFDTMEIKQKQYFHSIIIEYWHLEAIEQYVREGAEFVNLYSKTRGRNRFPCLLDSIDIIRDRPEVVQSGVKLPEFNDFRKWLSSGVALGNPTLANAVQQTNSEELKLILKWSNTINENISRNLKNIPPFSWAKKSLTKIHASSDSIVVSQTPTETLIREWNENDITKYVKIIAGQEYGTKTEHIDLATKGRYPSDKILMIGDAPGDLLATKENHAFFYPINPGHEDASWERFHEEAYDKFLTGTYGGEYEQKVIDEFEALLPEHPPWQKS